MIIYKIFTRCRFLAWSLALTVLACTLGPLPAQALSLIRDAEIEHTLKTYADPIFREAELNTDAIRIFIINSPDINAFVAGGANMFIHTGLILATDTPTELIGVMAHETGHIAGGHIIQGTEKLKDAEIGTIITSVLSMAAMAGGAREVGAAIMSGGQQVMMRNYLAYSRSNEQAADQAALTYLDNLNISAEGMLSVFEKLRRIETRRFGTIDPYMLTHPTSADRITHIRSHVMQMTAKRTLPARYQIMYDRMQAKLRGFIDPAATTLRRYPLRDVSVPARYARAVAYYRMPDLANALKEVDSLTAEFPKDPFFHELKGQILFENGRAAEALVSYQKASALLPASPLILTDLARVEIAGNTPALIASAVKRLERATAIDNSNDATWELLSVAYGKQGNLGRSNLALAEREALKSRPGGITRYVNEAEKHLAKDSLARLRVDDLKRVAEKLKEDEEK